MLQKTQQGVGGAGIDDPDPYYNPHDITWSYYIDLTDDNIKTIQAFIIYLSLKYGCQPADVFLFFYHNIEIAFCDISSTFTQSQDFDNVLLKQVVDELKNNPVYYY